jgi:hypothetical protein
MPQGKAVVAAARRLASPGKQEDHKPRNDTGWQDRAWKWYDVIGEFHFACAWVGNLMSRVTLEVHQGIEKVETGDAYDALNSLFGGPEGQKEMFRQLGVQFTVAGEGYIVGEDGGETVDDKWLVVASSELTKNGDVWKIGKKEVNNPLVIRLWRPHPRVNDAPDAPARAVLPVLAEIDGLTKHVAAQIDSRLAGAGILLLPDNISFATTSATGVTDDVTGETTQQNLALDPFLEELMQTMMTAIRNREDAAALVPILLQANGEHLDKVRHLTFSTPLDEQAIELRKEAIRRLALGMDMPPEILTGTGDINHWGAWAIEDASIKAHTEPLLQIIVGSLTEGYLWPYLEETGMTQEQARSYCFYANTSMMRLRPDRSKEAIELYDRAVLSQEALLTETGFQPTDAMDQEGVAEYFKRKVASGMTTPELVSAALATLGVHLPVDTIQVREHPAVDAPSLRGHPGHNPPEPGSRPHRPTNAPSTPVNVPTTPDIAVGEVIVFRALERAGNRIKSKYRDHISMGAENVPPHTLYRFTQKLTGEEVDDILMDAWSCLGSLPPISIPASTMDAYVRELITTNQPYDSRTFESFVLRAP